MCYGFRATTQRRNQARGWSNRFAGFRVNCESVPRLPARAIRPMMDDPRQIPYLLLWRDRFDCGIREALRVVIASENWIELKRPAGSCQRTKLQYQALPHGGTALLLACPSCSSACRHLYGWSKYPGRVARSLWLCRTCAGLSYHSEGCHVPMLFRGWGRDFPRAEPWDPLVFSNPEQANEFLRVT